MIINGRTILITGGASGIGFALAKRFVSNGNKVIICGRRKEQLELARLQVPSLAIYQTDLKDENSRLSFFERVSHDFPAIDVLINNAGVQNRSPALKDQPNWESHRQEIAINLEAPLHLTLLFLPQFKKLPDAAIVNVTSGLAFVPLSFMPTYCATKAALHSFTLSLRYQLAKTSIQVIEIVPPMVNTDLGGKGLHNDGISVDLFADHCMAHLEKGDLEFGFGFSETSRNASREQLNEIFNKMNRL